MNVQPFSANSTLSLTAAQHSVNPSLTCSLIISPRDKRGEFKFWYFKNREEIGH